MAIYFGDHVLEKGEHPNTESKLTLILRDLTHHDEGMERPSNKPTPGLPVAHHGSTGSMAHPSGHFFVPRCAMGEDTLCYLAQSPYWFFCLGSKTYHSGKNKWKLRTMQPIPLSQPR